MASPAKPIVIASGPYEFNPGSGELRKEGMRVRLEGQPLAILQVLLDRPGELVTREELRKKLWPGDTFVDFEHSLNAAVKRLRAALNDSAEHPHYIETLARRGYRFIAPVTSAGSEAEVEASFVNPNSAVTRTRSAVRGRGLWLSVVAVFVVAAVALGWRLWGHRDAASATPAIRSLAVLPLENLSGDPAQEYLADGMTEELTGQLSKIHGLRVISRTSAMHFKHSQLSVPEMAIKLRVDAIVEGSVIREGNRIRVHAQLIRAPTDEHFWSENYDREVGDALVLESDIAQSIAQRVDITITGEEHARLIAAHHVSPEVYESYLKGRFAKGNTKAEVEQSVAYFEDAIRKDPTFAPAYVGLASAYEAVAMPFVGGSPDEVRPKVTSALRKALELDPRASGANLLLAQEFGKQWRWAESQTEYKRALELNPNDPGAHLGFAYWLMFQGRSEEAIAWCQRARELDPLGADGIDVGWLLFHAHRYDEAIRELRSAIAVNPDDAVARWFLGFALIANGQSEDAIHPLEKAVSLTDGSPAVIGVLVRAYAHAGRRPDALRLLDDLKRRRQKGYVPPAAFVNAYLGLGDREQAFAWLERAYQEQAMILLYLKVHPFFDPIRNDPRFVDLVQRVGLDKSY